MSILKDDIFTEPSTMSINRIIAAINITALQTAHLKLSSRDLQFFHDSKLNHKTVREYLDANRAIVTVD
jgi:hypothetical protein